jgi:cyclophilin family peptidyl-prolyl cis-trans isomerase
MADKPRVRIDTSEGELVLELWPEVAPRHVENFMKLVHDGFYDGLTFHRVVKSFIVQAGCPHGDGTGGPGFNIVQEFNDSPHDRGTLGMARTSDPNSAGSQFFICLDRANCQHLDREYTVFGQVVRGLDTVDRIAAVPIADPDLFKPVVPPQILHCREMYHDEA